MERAVLSYMYPLTFRIGLNWHIGFGIGCRPCNLLRLPPENHYRPERFTRVSVERQREIE
jgi:hypothetical protein